MLAAIGGTVATANNYSEQAFGDSDNECGILKIVDLSRNELIRIPAEVPIGSCQQ